jgi:hypothetical protein
MIATHEGEGAESPSTVAKASTLCQRTAARLLPGPQGLGADAKQMTRTLRHTGGNGDSRPSARNGCWSAK